MSVKTLKIDGGWKVVARSGERLVEVEFCRRSRPTSAEVREVLKQVEQ